MNAEQLTHLEAEDLIVRPPILSTVQVGETQVLQGSLPDIASLDDTGQSGGYIPNIELNNLREEAEYLYQDNQKTQQNLARGQTENEELKEKIKNIQDRLVVAEQKEQIQRCHFERQLHEQTRIIDEKNGEIEELKGKMDLQSQDCARLKQKIGECGIIEMKWKKAVKDLSVKNEEVRIMEELVKDHDQCALKIDNLECENSNLSSKLDDTALVIRMIQDEHNKLNTKLQALQVICDLKDNQYKSELSQRQKLERKFNILKGDNPIPTSINASTHRFELRKSYLPECVRCKSCLVQEGAIREECKYHPCKPLPYRSWVRMFSEDSIAGTSSKNMYWRCCKQFSTIEPEGCTSHPNHLV